MKDSPVIGSTIAVAVGRKSFSAVSWSTAQCWTLTACLAFTFAMAYAIAVVIFRLPGPGFGNGHLFRIALALHVELAVFFWLMATAAAEWSAGRPALGRWPPLLAALFTVVVALSPLAGGTPLMADYFPWLADNRWFSFGFVGFCLAVLWATVAALTAGSADGWQGARVSALPAIAAALTALADFANGAEGLAELVWGAGHTLLFAHVALMCWEWSRLSGTASRVARAAVGSLAAIATALPLLPFIHAPGTAAHHHAFTWAMTWLLWPPAIVVGILVLHRWRCGASLPALTRLVFPVSFVLLLAGCALGALIDGPTTLVTAHYHATMGAVAISRMGMAYFEARELTIAMPSLRAARLQLIAYTCGLVFLAAGLVVAAVDSAPRKTASMENRAKGPLYTVGMSVSGVGGLLAMLGSSWLVINLLGRRRAEGERACAMK